ncbi:MAG TPA: YraN family protein [Candidatus Angelobacter sp.]|nr:YraN family protein [Candidatus Angelobacter sp.]
MSGRLVKLAIRVLDSLPGLPRRTESKSEHLRIGRQGEEEAYFHLRTLGYVMVARNYRTQHSRSELDMVGWDGDVLCFIEVKTRTSRDAYPAESAVDDDKRRDLSRVARAFLRKIHEQPHFRFDIVSVYFHNGGQEPEIELRKNAFEMA